MGGTGYCATAVQRALEDVGLGQFMGSGNAWEMLEPLKNSGLFEVIPASQATRGDIIVRPPSANPTDDSIYGDISVVTGRQGGQIIQTNDATYAFEANNPRYDGKAVFLRYKGDSDQQVASNNNNGDGERRASSSSSSSNSEDSESSTTRRTG